MSWIEQIKQDMQIVTGDGKEYRPMWFTAEFDQRYNTEEFNFVGVSGSLVNRERPKGRVIDLEFHFQGADCLTVAEAFRTSSAANPAPWAFYHPMHGKMNVQPISLRFNKTGLNIVKVTGTAIETLAKAPNALTVAPAEKVSADASVTVDTAAEQYTEDVPEVSVTDLERIQATINDTYAAVSVKIANVQANLDIYTEAYSRANSVLNTAIFGTQDIIDATLTLLYTPYAFTNTVQQRIDMFKLQLDGLTDGIAAILAVGLSRQQAQLKRLYEVNGLASLTGMCRSTVTNVRESDYAFRPNVLKVIADIITYYNQYIDNLCDLQTATVGYPSDYTPNAGSVVKLSNLVYYTLSNLYLLAEDAKQQRTYTLPYDSNLIIVARDLYGLNVDDSTLQTLLATNDIPANEFLILKKDREILYYI